MHGIIQKQLRKTHRLPCEDYNRQFLNVVYLTPLVSLEKQGEPCSTCSFLLSGAPSLQKKVTH